VGEWFPTVMKICNDFTFRGQAVHEEKCNEFTFRGQAVHEEKCNELTFRGQAVHEEKWGATDLTQHHVPQELSPQLPHCENLTSCTVNSHQHLEEIAASMFRWPKKTDDII
jgi:hypothetical protein